MSVDKSLLNLEKHKGPGDDNTLPTLKMPGITSDATADLEMLAEGLFTGKSAKELDDLNAKLTGYVNLVPEPGLCVKMKDKSGKKLFLNLCTSDRVPALPRDISEEELVAALQADDVSFKVPMSIGEPHNETDHAGESSFWSLALEGMEHKYGLAIDRNTTVILRGKKFYGTLMEQRVRTKPKLITELGSEDTPADRKPEDDPVQLYLIPELKLWLDPVEKSPRCLSAEIYLPNAKTKEQLNVFVSDNRLVLSSSLISPKNYRLDILFPSQIESEIVTSTFDAVTKLLTVSAPLKLKEN
ncbi:putative PIH1 domain-containing protein 1 [Hypsibius exemplaris]|uniref:PIH1 domain-containing protein 1 n=1 Tax=Hypsibius exemplaris TaxID=2072580 RepID=A0A1W0X845_HYPEX|nr:putative PIH1 domain-containing protein 1 [Hypsibius exemplaris]